jgi:Domain of unknown function (DUF4340)
MNTRRFIWLLVAALAVIALAIWVSSRRHLDRDLTAGDLVLPGLEQRVNSVSSIDVRKGDGTHATLVRSGSAWKVSERDWPADLSKVRKLLLDLGALTIVEEKTRLPANYPALGVEDVSSAKAGGTVVEVVMPSGSSAIIIGKPSGGKSSFVRVAGTPQSLLATPLISADADPKSWLEHDLIDIGSARVRAVEEKPAEGPAFSVSRDKPAEENFTVSPIPKGRSLTGPAAAEGIAGALGALTLDDVRKAQDVPQSQVSHAVYHTFDGLDLDLAGRKDQSHSLLAISVRSSNKQTEAEAAKLNARLQGWEFEIPDYKYTAIFTPLEDLLVKPPQPAKKPATGAHAGKATAPPTTR